MKMKVCTRCWTPCMPDTEHRIEGKVVCHDCVIDYKLTPDPQPTLKEPAQ